MKINYFLLLLLFLVGVDTNAKPADKYAALTKSGNLKPSIVKLSLEEEANILKRGGVSVPKEFEATLFAPWQTANYPVYVAASPSGDLYVSSDGCGSLGRDSDRGRVLRLRDKDGDGRADEVTEFIPSINSPRGLIWDHDRLYLLHPPHVSVFFDRDGDGVAEENKRLISNIAFGFKDRPADHTTNGLDLGVDGWIYVAGGDFGFMKAIGTDGRTLQNRGGGVYRFRPDGSGLELFSYGTRNILATPASPLLDLFGRDNTNDGGGWNVRFHHFSGLDDHGYPRLYLNFADEIIAPLADYGGGSGCGGVYIHEPGFPKDWANAPFTCDWGTAGLYRHSVQRKGAGFIETEKPKKLISISRPTDADVDGFSRVYQASWKGPSSFNWAGPEHGFVVQVKPKGYQPKDLPKFDQLSDLELIKLFESPSQVRAIAAQRTLLRRPENQTTSNALDLLAGNKSKELRSRVIALYTISQRGLSSKDSQRVIGQLKPLAQDPSIAPFLMRILGDFGIDEVTAGRPGSSPAEWLKKGALSADPRTRLEAIFSAVRQRKESVKDAISDSLGHNDETLAHVAYRGISLLGAYKPALAKFTDPNSSEAEKRGAALALMRIHKPQVVDALIEKLKDPKSPIFFHTFKTLARLYHQEKEWDGKHWSGRPDNRGPYYEMVTWAESDRILAALRNALNKLPQNRVGVFFSIMSKNRIEDNQSLLRMVELAQKDSSLVPTLASQLVDKGDIPPSALKVLASSVNNSKLESIVLTQIVKCLLKPADSQYLTAIIEALILIERRGDRIALRPAKESFLKNNRKLDQYHHELIKLAKGDPAKSATRWAYFGLVDISSRKNAIAEAKANSLSFIDECWKTPSQKALLINVLVDLRNRSYDQVIIDSANDSNPSVSQAAQRAMRHLKIEAIKKDTSPQVSSLEPEQALAQIKAMKGDVSLGEAIFTKAACSSCHTVREDEPQKGPYLGNIASIYPRNELAEAILHPNKTIAQGFATNLVTMKDNRAVMGFVTSETPDKLVMRDMASQEHTLVKSEVANRTTLPNSMMPAGLMNPFSVKEFASLLDYVVGLSKQ
jgi:putative heme-binding domain-containing protein|tara:strand:+ start:1065 stop:4274 length:3210 start_codon:yes stop_codon:yes gene_type:complete